MKRIITFLVLFISWSFADSALLLEKGWQLIGSTSKIDDMSIFKDKDVEQIWHFDATNQTWRGYSPDSEIQKRMSDKGYDNITSLESWHGFWVKSKDEWVLTFKTDTAKSDEDIMLKKGWNLISLPINTVVSPAVFDDKTLWKYADNGKWEFFEKDTKEDFPIISNINNSDGIWVKSDVDQNVSVATNSAKLHNFSNLDDMKAYIEDMLLTNNRLVCGYYPMTGGIVFDTVMGAAESVDSDGAKNSQEPSSAQNASGTNIQEQGVDESDIVKHDDTTIFYASKNPKNWQESFINVTTFENIANNRLKPKKQIIIDGEVDSMYLVDGRLVVLSRYGYNYKPLQPTPQEKIDISYGGDISSMVVGIYNVSDLKKVATFKINGRLNSSRVVDGKLFLITNFTPYIRKTYPKIYIDAPECIEYFDGHYSDDVVSLPQDETSEPKPSYNDNKKYARCYNLYRDDDGRFYRFDYENPKITHKKLIPYIQKNSGEEKMLVTPKTLFAPNKKDQDPTITTVSKIDIKSSVLEKTSSVLGYNNTVYASKKALYLVSNKYPMFFNFDRYQERSVVYKFSLDSELAYKASGFVNGRVLNQFSLSEYKDILRIATTEGNSWQDDTENSIYTLKQDSDSLQISGVLNGLGKEGEIIRSVRFMGSRGYVVTFRQTDPFYTIDLTDANNPTKVGELKIDGYSSYLHLVGEDYILGIGRDAKPNGQVLGLKMELFDISDFANPNSVDSYNFGSRFSYSEMENNHKALAYRGSDKLFAFAYSWGGYWESRIKSLGIFQIVGDKINAYEPIKSPNSDLNYNSFERGLIFDINQTTYIAYFANGQIAYVTLDNLK